MPISYFAKHLSGLRRALPRSLPIEIVILWTVVAECCFACGNPYLPIRIIHLLELVQVACTFLPSPTTVIEHLLLFLDPARAFKRTPGLSKSPFPDVLFSRGSTSPILDLDFLDGISGAYEVLGLNKDDKDAVVSECLQRTLSEEASAFPLFSRDDAPSDETVPADRSLRHEYSSMYGAGGYRTGRLCSVESRRGGSVFSSRFHLLSVCLRSAHTGPSTPCPFDRIIAELYAFEAITLLDMYKRPVPGPLRRWSKKNRTPTGGILCPTIVLQWDSRDDGTVDGGAARVAGNDASSEQSGSARVVEGMVSNAYNNGKAPSSSCPRYAAPNNSSSSSHTRPRSGKGHGRQSRRNGSHAAPVISSAGDSAQTSSDSTSVTSTALVLHAPTAGLPLPPLPGTFSPFLLPSGIVEPKFLSRRRQHLHSDRLSHRRLPSLHPHSTVPSRLPPVAVDGEQDSHRREAASHVGAGEQGAQTCCGGERGSGKGRSRFVVVRFLPLSHFCPQRCSRLIFWCSRSFSAG